MTQSLDDIIQQLQTLQPQSDLAGFNKLLAEISKMIFPPESHLRLAWLPLDDLREQDINANSMSKQMFDQLVSNIQNADGALESVPLCATIEGEGDTIWIVSGHHRKRATDAAGETHMLVLIYDGLSWDRVRSKQLAHNAIAGTSDPEIIKRIWDKIDDVSARFESFIDPRKFDLPAPVSFAPVDISPQNMAKTVLLLFLPVQHSDFETALETAMPKGSVDKVYLAHKDNYNQWMAALRRVRDEMDIVAVPTAVAMMARLAMERLNQLAEEAEEAEEASS